MREQSWVKSWQSGLPVSIGSTVLLVALLAPFREHVGQLNAALAFLLLTLSITAYWGRAVGLAAAVLTNLAFNLFFLEPIHTLTVQEPRNVAALLAFLLVSTIGGALVTSARRSAEEAKRRQAETENALRLSRALSQQVEPKDALIVLCEEIARMFGAPGAAVFSRNEGGWTASASSGTDADRALSNEERLAADRALATGQLQGLGATGLHRSMPRRIVSGRSRFGPIDRQTPVVLIPLTLGASVLGVLRLDGRLIARGSESKTAELLSGAAAEAAMALQRIELAREAGHAEALLEADEMKTAIMNSISHDLKTPLMGIKAAVSSILDSEVRWSSDDLVALHKAIDSQANRLNRTISDILDMNRIEAGQLAPELTPVRARSILEDARGLTELESAGREVTVDAPEDAWMRCDAALIRQAVVNLIENAVKYSRAGGGIRLEASSTPEHVRLSVTDDGPGIAPADIPFVFGRFYRAKEQSRRVRGSGLGLNIVKSFVELSGGAVSVESSRERTCFSIDLPSVPSPLAVGQ